MSNVNITISGQIVGTISNYKSITGTIVDSGSITATLCMPEMVNTARPYEGETIVIPSTHRDKILPTKDRYVYEDITVLKIPTYETSNNYGYTFIIGDD